jgi:hypothetical protein
LLAGNVADGTTAPGGISGRSPRRAILASAAGQRDAVRRVVAGYGTDVDLDVIRAWWSLRSLLAVRWLAEHGFDPSTPGCEVDVLRSQL